MSNRVVVVMAKEKQLVSAARSGWPIWEIGFPRCYVSQPCSFVVRQNGLGGGFSASTICKMALMCWSVASKRASSSKRLSRFAGERNVAAPKKSSNSKTTTMTNAAKISKSLASTIVLCARVARGAGR